MNKAVVNTPESGGSHFSHLEAWDELGGHERIRMPIAVKVLHLPKCLSAIFITFLSSAYLHFKKEEWIVDEMNKKV